MRLYVILLSNFFFHVACRIVVPREGIEPVPSAAKARSPNHWTTREFPNFFYFLFFLLVSGVQQSDSVIHYRLLQDIEYSFLCYTVGPCCLFYI